MSSRGAALRPDLWPSLDPDEQAALLSALLQRRRGRLMNYSNVRSVGLGYRTTGADTITDEICLRFLVSKKQKRAQRAVPSPYSTIVTWKGSRHRCVIPTDVAILGKGSPTQGGWYPDGVVARRVPGVAIHANNPGTPGAICCRVVDRDQREDDYLLGCHHVLALSSSSAGCAPVMGIGVYHGQTGDFIGLTVRWTTLRAGGRRTGMDAALAKSTNDDKLPAWIRDDPPVAIGAGIRPPSTLVIRTPRGKIQARFLGLYEKLLLSYPCGDLQIGPVYELRAETHPGDSGSPVLDGGRLWGMHFYRTDAGTALAIPAWALFAEDRFRGITISLP